ncbi:hypothetical protein MJO28_008506 [Puccinia striiformis f. sp. tritici]|uniref:Uncharacterized protein n=1 Tax=Puccinia striiformis f. sp. tritici TaxID=168172 RepID=A0ACC0ECQ4_9BASI|nr:hypothetical protein Pst134EA_015426 [Puccinia striiformis f. sp. tritici]KAH9463343.1 hypothetical protein Pst134EA_015426 [Puccinia striiformis f. sp. tritici]KAI7949685.1 hypothetical protein MJO28_008506 [Puccinia striiformis f. sp. tritici]KAI7952769.1 hypothetical protein MJO29_008400 [Puccinia striiformis f. sp. tritici]
MRGFDHVGILCFIRGGIIDETVPDADDHPVPSGCGASHHTSNEDAAFVSVEVSIPEKWLSQTK